MENYRQRYLLGTMGLFLAIAPALSGAARKDPTVADRGLIIAVGSDAPPEVKSAAQKIAAAVGEQPLLKALANGHNVQVMDSATLLADKTNARAFNHVIIMGMPDDPAVTAVWQREAKLEPGGIFVFGFGHFKGDIGYIESDRNPFLHSDSVARAPFETELVTITGTTPGAVGIAADEFVKHGMINGVVASGAGGWTRPRTSLLDRDPISPDAQIPPVPQKMGGATLIGVTQASGDEYANVLADVGIEPTAIWRFKYYLAGAWDGAGAESAIAEYSSGLHRRAFADMVWVGVFESGEAAIGAAEKIAAAAKLNKASGETWKGAGKIGGGEPIELWAQGNCVYMSDLRH